MISGATNLQRMAKDYNNNEERKRRRAAARVYASTRRVQKLYDSEK